MNEQTKLTPDQELLELMRRKELREAKEYDRLESERAEAKANYESRRNTQIEGDRQVFISAAQWQARCDHRKGTGGKKKWRHIDYNLSRFTFPNGLTQIKCLKCRFKAYPGDTAELCSYTMENYLKGGKKVPNPSKLSYAQWYTMTLDENTTNTEARSEMVTQGPTPVTS